MSGPLPDKKGTALNPLVAPGARRILVVDDERSLRTTLSKVLVDEGHSALTADSAREAVRLHERELLDLVILDWKLPDGGGLDVLSRMLDRDPDLPVIIITAFPDVKNAVKAMKHGAFDYIVKPFDLDELLVLVERALIHGKLRSELRRLRQSTVDMPELLGSSPEMVRLRELVARVAATPTSTVLVRGPSGAGKELVADGLHRMSQRRDGPLVKLNCSAIPADLLEAELFGYEKGSYTGAREGKKGLIEMAHRGTLLLDEVADLHLTLQPKLLRVLEDGSFRRVGGLEDIQVDVRIVASTHRDMERLIQRGDFRQDLYYRINVISIDVPALADHTEDVPELVNHFLAGFIREMGKPIQRLTPQAMEALVRHRWPGNVRELRNVTERAVMMADAGQIGLEHLPDEVARNAVSGPVSTILPSLVSSVGGRPASLAEAEREHIMRVLSSTANNKSEACRILEISRSTLREKLLRYQQKPGL